MKLPPEIYALQHRTMGAIGALRTALETLEQEEGLDVLAAARDAAFAAYGVSRAFHDLACHLDRNHAEILAARLEDKLR